MRTGPSRMGGRGPGRPGTPRPLTLRCAAVIAICGVATAQADPLDDAMRSSFPKNLKAATLRPSPDPDLASSVWARVSFHTSSKEVTLDWHAKALDAEPLRQLETHPVAFEPTAVCVTSGPGADLYVAGYVARTGHVTVERWQVRDLVLGSALPQGGSGPAKSILGKEIRKDVVLLSDDIGPLHSIVHHGPQGMLWLFEDGPPQEVWQLDPEAGGPVPFGSASIIPELAAAKHAAGFTIAPAAPDGGGFVVILYPWRAWRPAWVHEASFQPYATWLYLFRDQDLNGSIDESTALNWIEMVEDRQYFEHMVAPGG